jgi:hypothetical protein
MQQPQQLPATVVADATTKTPHGKCEMQPQMPVTVTADTMMAKDEDVMGQGWGHEEMMMGKSCISFCLSLLRSFNI